MTDRELMQQALNALEEVEQTLTQISAFKIYQKFYETIEAFRARLAQPEQKPVAQVHVAEDYHPHVIWAEGINAACFDQEYLYITPPQREWQGLTDEEIREFEIWLDGEEEKHGWNPPADIVKYIEAKLKAKNGY